MPVRLSKTQARAYGLKPKATKLTARQRYDGYASSWEQEYATYLDMLRVRREIISWSYESIKLLLGTRATYTPDFLLETTEQLIEIHEIKGRMYAAGMAKLRIAARQFPQFRFLLVRKVNGMWDYEEIPR